MEKITSREILHQIRDEAAKKISDSRCRILICAGTGCLAGGSGEIYRRMSKLAEENTDITIPFTFTEPEITTEKMNANLQKKIRILTWNLDRRLRMVVARWK